MNRSKFPGGAEASETGANTPEQLSKAEDAHLPWLGNSHPLAFRKQQDGSALEKGEIVRALSLFTQLGISMAACVFAGVLLGKLLDRRLGTTPWLLALCALIGGIAAIKTMYDIVIRRWK